MVFVLEDGYFNAGMKMRYRRKGLRKLVMLRRVPRSVILTDWPYVRERRTETKLFELKCEVRLLK